MLPATYTVDPGEEVIIPLSQAHRAPDMLRRAHERMMAPAMVMHFPQPRPSLWLRFRVWLFEGVERLVSKRVKVRDTRQRYIGYQPTMALDTSDPPKGKRHV